MPYIELNGMQIFYILHKSSTCGDSAAVILIHGAGGNHLSMLNIFSHIKKKYGGTYNILVFDLPYHFRSSMLASKNTLNLGDPDMPDIDGISFYAKSLKIVASKLFPCGTKFILIGHSMGAQICIKFASLFPNSVEKTMLIAGCHKTAVNCNFIESLKNSFDRTIMLFLRDALDSKDKNILKNALADIKRTHPQVVVNDFKYIKYFSRHCIADIKRISRANIFFDLIYSKKDLLIDYECLSELHGKLINSEIHGIPAKSHMDFLYGNSFMEKEIDKFLLTQARVKL
jgi:pimeloyl-ACP methyl ester carboxylesterase